MLLNVKLIVRGQGPPLSVSLDIGEGAKGRDLKEALSVSKGHPTERMELIHDNTRLGDETLLQEAGVFAETSIMCIVNPAPEDAPPVARSAPSEDSTISLTICKLDGHQLTLDGVGVMEPFGAIRSRLAEMIHKPVGRVILIYSGAALKDTDTPAGKNCVDASCIHLVISVGDDDDDGLHDVIAKEDMHANCPFCAQAGVLLSFRYKCKNCLVHGAPNPEQVLVERPLDLGTSRWEDILGMKCMCFNGCGESVDCTVCFKCCSVSPEGKACASTLPARREMVASYCGTSREQLRRVLDRIFGYAHLGGYVE